MTVTRTQREKRLFVGFAIEDEWARNLLKGQERLGSSPIDYTDMSAKEAWSEQWKTQCRARIKGCDGMVAFISSNTRNADGARWEIKCAIDEGVPVLGIWTDANQTYVPPELPASKVKRWTWPNIGAFVDGLK